MVTTKSKILFPPTKMEKLWPSATKYTVNRFGDKIPVLSALKTDREIWYRCLDPNQTIVTYYAQSLGDLEPSVIWSCKRRIRQDPEPAMTTMFLEDRITTFLSDTYITEEDFVRDLCLFPLIPSVNLFEAMILVEIYLGKSLGGPVFRDTGTGVWYGRDSPADPEPIRRFLLNHGMNELAKDLSWLDRLPKYYLWFILTRGCCRPLTPAQLILSQQPLTEITRAVFPVVKNEANFFLRLSLEDLPRIFESPFPPENLVLKLPEYLKFLSKTRVDLNQVITVDDQVLSEILNACTDNQIYELAGKESISELKMFPTRDAWIENTRNVLTVNNKSRT